MLGLISISMGLGIAGGLGLLTLKVTEHFLSGNSQSLPLGHQVWAVSTQGLAAVGIFVLAWPLAAVFLILRTYPAVLAVDMKRRAA